MALTPRPRYFAHVTSTARQALLLTIIVWLAVSYGSYVVAELIAGRTGFVHDLPIDLPAILLVALLAYALYPVAECSGSSSPIVRWSTMLIAVIAVAFVVAYDVLPRYRDGVFYSLENYTSLGLTRITVDDHWRMLAPMISLSGVFCLSWSTAVLVSFFGHLYSLANDDD